MAPIDELLARKIELDGLGPGDNSFTQRFRWLLEAVEVLLRIERDRSSRE